MLPETDEVVCVQLQTVHRAWWELLTLSKPEFIVMLVAIRQKVKLEVTTYFDKMTQERPRKMMINVLFSVLPDSATDCDSSDAEASQKDTDSRLFVISQEGNQQSHEFLKKNVFYMSTLATM
ncbi:unnamed protein product [Brassica oleracea var. botrytis]|uniref:Uncharacterized protein n=1 Tax=Brassica oleracea TaxID=3712 RepID=A0A3P6E901_BRAOL|nr:unnamed protein product [Brassica oleracea]